MKQHLLELARNLSSQSSNWNARNLVREYLQARILEGLVRAGAMASVAFMGGTALRFLFGLQRYSEDLDFSLEGNRENYDPQRWTEKIVRQFHLESYELLERTRASTVVHRVDFRFPRLLYELGLSPRQDSNADELTSDNWRQRVADRVAQVPWDRVITELNRFVESEDDAPGRDRLLSLL